jgi:hypothetical protein
LDISTDKATSGMSCLPILGSSLSQASQTSNKLYFYLSVKSALEKTIKILILFHSGFGGLSYWLDVFQ